MTVIRTCPTCDYTHTYRSVARADAHHPRHDCARQARRANIAAEQAQRAMLAARDTDRGCLHPGAPHRHGTRAAYVKDRCRCRACTTANTAASRAAKRAKALGRWAPYLDAGPVRHHIQSLREAGIGYARIATLAGTSSSHVRELAGTAGRSGHRPPIRRVRRDTAERILTIAPTAANHATRSQVDATGTRRRLQALVALGWTFGQLATELERTVSNLKRTLRTHWVTADTAVRVAAVYERLWDSRPDQSSPSSRAAANAARAHAREHGWPPPLAWNDIDTDPAPPDAGNPANLDIDLDEIAIERAMAGDHCVRLTAAERIEAVHRLSARGRSIATIAELLSTSKRTVSRHRRRASAA